MASRLYNNIKKLDESIATELTNQSTAKANLDRLDKEKQTHQAVANNKQNTPAEIADAKEELKRIAEERKVEETKLLPVIGR